MVLVQSIVMAKQRRVEAILGRLRVTACVHLSGRKQT